MVEIDRDGNVQCVTDEIALGSELSSAVDVRKELPTLGRCACLTNKTSL